MRITLTLDDDIAATLRAEARRSGRPFREIVNDVIRAGLMSCRPGPFSVVARDLGKLRPGLELDNIADVIERVEGPLHQ